MHGFWRTGGELQLQNQSGLFKLATLCADMCTAYGADNCSKMLTQPKCAGQHGYTAACQWYAAADSCARSVRVIYACESQ